MPLPPDTTPAPQPKGIFLPGMTPTTAAPAPSPLPVWPKQAEDDSKDSSAPSTAATTEDSNKPTFDVPRLRLHINDLSHAGTHIFLRALNDAPAIFARAVLNVQTHLYSTPTTHTTHCPPTRSVTLILRAMDGVAYTTGTDLDNDHKEIHLSLKYVAAQPEWRQTQELTGVLTHELVHCYQHNGLGAAPGGLIEGVADWVRLRCSLAPPHWKRDDAGARWDAGYQHTAYFLEYLDVRFGDGTVRRLNEKLRVCRYEQKPFWTELLGRPVEQLWDDYKAELKKGKEGEGDKGGKGKKQEDAKGGSSKGSTTTTAATRTTENKGSGEQEKEDLETDGETSTGTSDET
ncbi:Uu.00g010180.m01.CDS01 [Anthostomella pinea]|uniref:Uu.00g010180.m01.CDS01 n=1 Tax=Anthostomella pinea TaxID=933095 RepID=A0AAI8VY72_9PEZI|nr:Uu.00g010180.m01.CDS01 [Anthostomella pinea]